MDSVITHKLEFSGRLQFDPDLLTSKHQAQSTWKSTCVCLVAGDIDLYYSHVLRKRFNLELNRSIRGAHVTVINDRVENQDSYDTAKALMNGTLLTFTYDPAEIRTNGTHWWLRLSCPAVADLRVSAGLQPVPYFGLHLTLGYSNDKNLHHSEYILRQILRFGL